MSARTSAQLLQTGLTRCLAGREDDPLPGERGFNEQVFVTQRRAALRRLQLGEPLPHAARRGEVALAFVAVECLLERSGRLVAAAGGGENLGEVAKRVALQVQSVGPLRVLDCLACKSYSVGMSTALGENARLHLAPQCLRQQIFVVPKVAALLGQRLRLVIAPSAQSERPSIGAYDESWLRRCSLSSLSQ